MGVPTVTKIHTASGPTGGRRLVKIWGGNFQLTPEPSDYGVTPVANPTVEVLFGDVPAREVQVMARSLLHVLSPIHNPGLVDLTIRNIDQDGVLVPGETVTIANAYTFARPTIGASTPGAQSNLTRLVRALIDELKRQVLANVELATHTDYDDTPDGANITALAAVPGLALSGPFTRLNRFYSSNQPREEDDTEGNTFELYPGRTIDLAFTLIGVDELLTRGLDLMNECDVFFIKNTTLRMLRDPAIAGDYVEYEMEIDDGGDFKAVGTANNSNIRAFSGSFIVRGFTVDDADMRLRSAREVTDVVTALQQLPPEE